MFLVQLRERMVYIPSAVAFSHLYVAQLEAFKFYLVFHTAKIIFVKGASDFSIVSPVKTLYLDLSSAFSCIDHSFLKYSPLVLLQFCLLCFHWLCFIFVGSSSIQILTYRTVNFFFPVCHNLAHSPFLYIPMTLFDFLPRLLSLQSHISSSSFTSLNISNLTPAQ